MRKTWEDFPSDGSFLDEKTNPSYLITVSLKKSHAHYGVAQNYLNQPIY